MKALSPENYVVRPFVTHKAQTYTYTYLSGSNPNQVSIDFAMAPTWSILFDSASDAKNPSGIYERPLYSSIEHLFYSSESLWNAGSNLDKGWVPQGNVYVVSLAQPSYGQEIQDGTFLLSIPTATASFVDNGSGSVVCSTTRTPVGNIFYSLGIVVLQQATGSATGSGLSQFGLYLTTGSAVTLAFNATHTIYEHSAFCTMDSGEFNYSINPSMVATTSAVGDSVKILDLFASGTLSPYFTTVGLYTSRGELVAVGKLAKAIKRAPESQQTVVVRFDI